MRGPRHRFIRIEARRPAAAGNDALHGSSPIAERRSSSTRQARIRATAAITHREPTRSRATSVPIVLSNGDYSATFVRSTHDRRRCPSRASSRCSRCSTARRAAPRKRAAPGVGGGSAARRARRRRVARAVHCDPRPRFTQSAERGVRVRATAGEEIDRPGARDDRDATDTNVRRMSALIDDTLDFAALGWLGHRRANRRGRRPRARAAGRGKRTAGFEPGTLDGLERFDRSHDRCDRGRIQQLASNLLSNALGMVRARIR